MSAAAAGSMSLVDKSESAQRKLNSVLLGLE